MKFCHNKSNYAHLATSWTPNVTKEQFLIAYAVEGQIQDPAQGLRAGLPSIYPLVDSPVAEPSPLNTRWRYLPQITPATHFPSTCGV